MNALNKMRLICSLGVALIFTLLAAGAARAGSYVGPYYSGSSNYRSTAGYTYNPATQTVTCNPGGSYQTTNFNVTATLTATFNWVPETGMTIATDPPPNM